MNRKNIVDIIGSVIGFIKTSKIIIYDYAMIELKSSFDKLEENYKYNKYIRELEPSYLIYVKYRIDKME